jgi:hypothetical protein
MTQTTNEAWLDALIRHQVGLMRLAPSISEKVGSLLNASEKDIVDQIKTRATKGMNTARLEGLLKTGQAAPRRGRKCARSGRARWMSWRSLSQRSLIER